jgi:SAM-dependent methyltransferase
LNKAHPGKPDTLPQEVGVKNPAPADADSLANQVYLGTKARGYEFGQTECDANVYAWARRKVESLAAGLVAADIGCGKGQLLSAMESARLLVGIDASEDMVREMPEAAGRNKVVWPVRAQELAGLLQERQLIVCGRMEDVLPGLGVALDLALSAFNIVCFADAAVPLAIMHRCLKTGGRLVAISNVWVPRELAPQAADLTAARSVDLHAAARACPQDLAPGQRFRLVLELRSPQGEPAPYPLLDHVHTLGDYARALDPASWAVEELLLFAPEACCVVDPAVTSRYSHLYAGTVGADVLSPAGNLSFKFAKVCLVAVKK